MAHNLAYFWSENISCPMYVPGQDIKKTLYAEFQLARFRLPLSFHLNVVKFNQILLSELPLRAPIPPTIALASVIFIFVSAK